MKHGSSLGIASLVLGILAFVICWIPLVNVIGMPLAALGLLLGVIGGVVALGRSGHGIGFSVAGSSVCALAMLVAIFVNRAVLDGLRRVTVAADTATADAGRPRISRAGRTAPLPTSPIPVSEPLSTAKDLVVPPPTDEWSIADVPAHSGDVNISLTSIKVGPVEIDRHGSVTTSSEHQLQIGVSLQNSSETKKIAYRPWGQSFLAEKGLRLTDNFGNSYRPVEFGVLSRVVGRSFGDSIYPGKSLSDVLVFEPPVGKVETLNLELPADRFGGTGVVRIHIPASMIVWEPSPGH